MSDVKDRAEVTLPLYDLCFDKERDGVNLTALERFIFTYEPQGADEWRDQLAAVIREAKRC